MENEWTISFNPNAGRPVPVEDIVSDLAPLVISATMETPERYQLVLADEMTEDDKDMEKAVLDVIQRIGEVYPDAVIVGHVDDESVH